MTEEQIALAKRAVACKGWKWLPGMLDIHGGRVVSVEGGLLRLDYRDDDDPIRTSTSACLPDLTDPATLGCLLALYENTRTTLTCPDPVYTYAAAYGLLHPRTVEALVTALEAKP